MPEMTDERAKPGPKPLPAEQKGKRVNLYLSPEAVKALAELAPPPNGNASALVSALLVAEAERRRRRSAKP